MSRPRSVCYTLNNPTEEDKVNLKSLITKYAEVFKYHVFQYERGANGTLHVQGFIQAKNPTYFNTWKRHLSTRAHIEATRGTPQQARAYCTKDDTREPGTLIYEEGEIPSPGKRNDILAFAEALQEDGRTLRSVVEEFPEQFLRFPNAHKQFRFALCKQRDFKTKVFWFFGATGTGKSFKIRELAPDAYWKSCDNHWFDGYDPIAHLDIVFDDYRADFCKFSQLLRYFDEYPLDVQYKGGTSVFRPRRIFVSSPVNPLEMWSHRCQEDLQQLTRRIEVIVKVSVVADIRCLTFVKGNAVDLEFGSGDRLHEPTRPLSSTLQEGGEPPTQRRRFIVEEEEFLDHLIVDEL